MDSHSHGTYAAHHAGHDRHVEVHEANPGASDEPVALVAIAVLGALIVGICILWFYSSVA